MRAKDRRVELLAYRPEAPKAAEGELGAGHLPDRAAVPRNNVTTGAETPAQRAPPSTFALALSRQ